MAISTVASVITESGEKITSIGYVMKSEDVTADTLRVMDIKTGHTVEYDLGVLKQGFKGIGVSLVVRRVNVSSEPNPDPELTSKVSQVIEAARLAGN
jgi:hypothetical protein